MLRQIKLDKFPKKSSSYRPQIVSNITLQQRRVFEQQTPKFIVHDNLNNVPYQLYITKSLNASIKQNLQFIQNTPKILLLQHEPYSLVFEQSTQQSLNQYLYRHEFQTGLPYITQSEAKDILLGVLRSLQSFEKNSLNYSFLTGHSILRSKTDWMLSLATALVSQDSNFSNTQIKGKQALFYSIGLLTFEVLFGFVPFESDSKIPVDFKLSSYIDFLQQQSSKKLLKIYYFADRIQLLSQKIKILIQQCLSKKIITFEQFKNHAYFAFSPDLPKKEFILNKQIKMLAYFEKKYHSLIMAAIQKRKKNPHQRLHPIMEKDISGFIEIKEIFSKDSFLKHFLFDHLNAQTQIQNRLQRSKELKIDCQYFGMEFNFKQKERPTLELIKFINQDKSKNQILYQKQNRQANIILYAFPYTMVFQLANVYCQQPIQVKQKIEELIPLLLQVSAMSWPIKGISSLHQIKAKYSKFEEFKGKFRQLINFLYKNFLMEAMKRYNCKKQNLTIEEKVRSREEGLEYYKLCLKLMELSVIWRKKGINLDLQRIQTSQRKEVEQDLEKLLKTYFPSKIEIS